MKTFLVKILRLRVHLDKVREIGYKYYDIKCYTLLLYIIMIYIINYTLYTNKKYVRKI